MTLESGSVKTKSFGETASDVASLRACMERSGYAVQYRIIESQELNKRVSDSNIDSICSAPESFLSVMRDAVTASADRILKNYVIFNSGESEKAAELLDKTAVETVVSAPSVKQTAVNLFKGNLFNIFAAHDTTIVPQKPDERRKAVTEAMHPLIG